MNLPHYLIRLENVLCSRQDIEVETFEIEILTLGVRVSGIVRFYDGSRLSIVEGLEVSRKQEFNRLDYKFHYQDAQGHLIFRYDNAPHHPYLDTFPAHKHIKDKVVDAKPPDLNDVLAEIDAIIYPNSDIKFPT
jgi:hypothetical protein